MVYVQSGLSRFSAHLKTLIRHNKILSLLLFCISAAIFQVEAQIPLKAAQLSTGNPSCALTLQGGVKCWGPVANQTTALTAVDLSGLTTNVLSVTNACALMADKTVKCWGSNSFNQLGTGTGLDSPLPITVPSLTNVKAITSGSYHNCALLETGTVKCWGNNERGQLGVGTTTPNGQEHNYHFMEVQGLSGATAISAGIYHTCALLNTGGVKCWGDNSYAQLGIGMLENNYTALDTYQLSSGIKQISVGGISACAVTQTGKVKCWGYNNSTGGVPDGRFPTEILGFSGYVNKVSVGYKDKCVFNDNGAVSCWVNREATTPGELPIPGEVNHQPIADLVSNVTDISVGYDSVCALQGDQVKCWGSNFSGQLGNNTNLDSTTPVITLQSFSPSIGIVSAASGQAVVHFTPPTDDSGSAITGYTVTSFPAGGVDAYAGTLISHTGQSDLSHLITGLTNGTSYRFSVTATNAQGTGLPSNLSATVIPVDPSASSSSSTASNSSSAPTCGASQTIADGTYSGTLSLTDCTGGSRGAGYYYDSYQFSGQAGQQVAIQLNAAGFDSYLYLRNSTGVLKQDDDGGGGTNSRIPATSGTITLPTTGTYTIEVTSYSQNAVGNYSLTLTTTATSSASSVSLSSGFSSQSSISSSVSSQSSSVASSLSSMASSSSSSLSSSARPSSNSSSVVSSQASSRSSSSSFLSSISSLSSSVLSSSSSSRTSLSSSSASSSTAAQVATCSYTVNNEWNNGFTATIRITNSGSSVINGWSLNWGYSDRTRITNNWNSTLTGNNPYNATNLSWNGTLLPGQSAEFGFQGTKQNGTNASVPRVTGSGCQ